MMVRVIFKSQHGFSFIELMVAASITVAAIAALLSLLPLGLLAGRKATRMDMAVKLAQQRLEDIKTVPYSELDAEAESGSFIDDNGNLVASEALAIFMRDVDVTTRDMVIGTETDPILIEVTEVTVRVYYREKGNWTPVELSTLFVQ